MDKKKLIIKFSWPNATNGMDRVFFTTDIVCSYPEEAYIRQRIESRSYDYIVSLFTREFLPKHKKEFSHFIDDLRDKIKIAHEIQVGFVLGHECTMEHCTICDYYDSIGKICIIKKFH